MRQKKMKMNKITLKEFLDARELWRQQVEASRGANDIVIDCCDDEIICDHCNADACPNLDYVYVTEGYALCQSCANLQQV